MGEVSAQIFLQEKEDGLGWTYTKWLVNLGKGDGLLQEERPCEMFGNQPTVYEPT